MNGEAIDTPGFGFGPQTELVLWLRRFRPEVVLTFDLWRLYQLHPDHRAVGLAALNAILAAGNPRFFPRQPRREVQAYRVETVYLFATDQPDAWVDITETSDRKMAAIDCHLIQVGDRPDIAAQIRCNRDYGQQADAGAHSELRPAPRCLSIYHIT